MAVRETDKALASANMDREAIKRRLAFLGAWYSYDKSRGGMDNLISGLEEVWIGSGIISREEALGMVLPAVADGLGWPGEKDGEELLRDFVTDHFINKGVDREKAVSILKEHLKHREGEEAA
jgi:hypothetical protein